MRPEMSPWGEIDHCVQLCPGVYEVSTPSHGGVMAQLGAASRIFSAAARRYGFVEGGYLCFEEDCDAAVAIRELLDRGKVTPPVNRYYGPGEYEKAIDRSIQRYQPEYRQARQKRLEQKARRREGRDGL